MAYCPGEGDWIVFAPPASLDADGVLIAPLHHGAKCPCRRGTEEARFEDKCVFGNSEAELVTVTSIRPLLIDVRPFPFAVGEERVMPLRVTRGRRAAEAEARIEAFVVAIRKTAKPLEPIR
jgi:hypothetical protein